MELYQILALIAGAFNGYAFWLYNKGIFKGNADTNPNGATWFLWALITIVQAKSYDAMGADWTEVAVMATDSSLCFITFVFLFYKRKLAKLNSFSRVIIVLAIGAFILWQTTSAVNGNIMSQVPYAMAFWPTIKDAWDGATKENPKVWLIFTLSFALSVAVLYLKGAIDPWKYLFPAVAIGMHAVLAYVAFHRRRYPIRKT